MMPLRQQKLMLNEIKLKLKLDKVSCKPRAEKEEEVERKKHTQKWVPVLYNIIMLI